MGQARSGTVILSTDVSRVESFPEQDLLPNLSIRPPSEGLCSASCPENWLKSYKEASFKIVLEFFITV